MLCGTQASQWEVLATACNKITSCMLHEIVLSISMCVVVYTGSPLRLKSLKRLKLAPAPVVELALPREERGYSLRNPGDPLL